MASGRYEVRIFDISCEDLAAKDIGGTSDPFVEFDFDKFRTVRTETIRRNLSPTFETDESFAYSTQYPDRLRYKSLTISVHDKDIFGKDFIGMAKVDLHTLLTGPIRHRLELNDGTKPTGVVLFSLEMNKIERLRVFFQRASLEGFLTGRAAVAEPVSIGITTDSPDHKAGHIRSDISRGRRPEWSKLPQLTIHTHFRSLFQSSLIVQIFQGTSSSIIGTAKLPLRDHCGGVKDGPAITIRAPVMPSSGSAHRGWFDVSLYFKGFPKHAQMIGGLHTNQGISEANFFHESVEKPKCHINAPPKPASIQQSIDGKTSRQKPPLLNTAAATIQKAWRGRAARRKLHARVSGGAVTAKSTPPRPAPLDGNSTTDSGSSLKYVFPPQPPPPAAMGAALSTSHSYIHPPHARADMGATVLQQPRPPPQTAPLTNDTSLSKLSYVTPPPERPRISPPQPTHDTYPAPAGPTHRVPVERMPRSLGGMPLRRDAAAVRVQSVWRGHHTRVELARQHQAAAKIQAIWRGHRVRKEVLGMWPYEVAMVRRSDGKVVGFTPCRILCEHSRGAAKDAQKQYTIAVAPNGKQARVSESFLRKRRTLTRAKRRPQPPMTKATAKPMPVVVKAVPVSRNVGVKPERSQTILPSPGHWSCTACTYHNKIAKTQCSMCGTVNKPVQRHKLNKPKPLRQPRPPPPPRLHRVTTSEIKRSLLPVTLVVHGRAVDRDTGKAYWKLSGQIFISKAMRLSGYVMLSGQPGRKSIRNVITGGVWSRSAKKLLLQARCSEFGNQVLNGSFAMGDKTLKLTLLQSADKRRWAWELTVDWSITRPRRHV